MQLCYLFMRVASKTVTRLGVKREHCVVTIKDFPKSQGYIPKATTCKADTSFCDCPGLANKRYILGEFHYKACMLSLVLPQVLCYVHLF